MFDLLVDIGYDQDKVLRYTLELDRYIVQINSDNEDISSKAILGLAVYLIGFNDRNVIDVMVGVIYDAITDKNKIIELIRQITTVYSKYLHSSHEKAVSALRLIGRLTI